MSSAHDPAQRFPSRPVRIYTSFPAGSGPEGVTRLVAEKLARRWGQPVTVENRPGANGFLAIDEFRRGATDGHDLIQLDNVHLSAYPHLFRKLPYDPRRDFEQIAPLFRTHFFVTVPTTSRYRTIGDLIADAKAQPGRLRYGSWSVGDPAHLGGALFEAVTATEMEHVIHCGSKGLYQAVADGDLSFAFGTPATVAGFHHEGRLRLLAYAAPERHPSFPDVPTVAEAGGPAGFEVPGWTTIAAPRGVPATVLDAIGSDIGAALAEPDVADRFASFGYERFPATRDELARFIDDESARFAAVIRNSRASLD